MHCNCIHGAVHKKLDAWEFSGCQIFVVISGGLPCYFPWPGGWGELWGTKE